MKVPHFRLILAAGAMLLLILDSKTAIAGAAEGLELCIRTLFPALFPFLVISAVLTASLTGQPLRLLHPLGRLCRIPRGAESLFLIGLLGGYPVGARCVAQAYRSGALKKEDARRMLGFCSNAGPSFLFGILGTMFTGRFVPWLLWGIHIVGAVAAGVLLPGGGSGTVKMEKTTASIQTALEGALRTMGLICGWVVLFRMLISFLERWILWLLPQSLQVLFVGLLELSNGCILLGMIEADGLRFLIASVILALGGLCVTMQTASVTDGLSLTYYYPGKLLQCGVSILLAIGCQVFFPEKQRVVMSPAIMGAVILIMALGMLFLGKIKKRSSNPAPVGV